MLASVSFASSLFAGSIGDLRSLALQHESVGDLRGAKAALQQGINSGDTSTAEAYAEFLDRHNDPESRQAYLQWIEQEKDPERRKAALRQLVLDDFIAGRDGELRSDLAQYRATGGSDLVEPVKPPKASPDQFVTIPGPLGSFARMAALTPDLAPEELLPALARNVVTNGFEAAGNEALQQTEYLRLLVRYVGQARELQAMAGSRRTIKIPACDSDETGALLKILGYRMRGSCGGDIVLETVNPTRAFLTVDSGFPLAQLEQNLRANHVFELPYAPTQIPVLYTPDYWLKASGRPNQTDFLDAFLSDPSLCRLYLGLSHVDRATAEALRKQMSPAKLKVYAHVLDFYGGMFQIQNGAAVVPGPPKAWASIVGVSPSNPGAFFERLLAEDDGWTASYFDALSRISGPTARYLTQPERIRRFYEALRGKITTPGPARPVFRSSTELMLLTTSLRIDQNGQPHIPGDIDVWRTLFLKHPHGKYDGRLTRSANSWRSSDDLLEALFALSRKTVENEPLRIFLTLSDIDRERATPISPATASRLISNYRTYGAQYSLFADSPTLSEASINHYLETAASISSIHDGLLRADTVGTFQALTELWRVLSSHDQIPQASRDQIFSKLTTSFTHIRGNLELFDAGRAGVDLLLASAKTGGAAGVATSRQAHFTELLVGPAHPSGSTAASQPVEMFLRIFDSQRLIDLDSIFLLADKKDAVDPKVLKSINEQLSRLEESESLRGSLSPEEKSAAFQGYWSTRHIEQERKLNLARLLRGPEKRDLRESLAPLLRDSLVGLLYSYYAPAGAQLLLANPQFVRAHDFIGSESSSSTWRMTEVSAGGWPVSSGGKLNGSLVALPYAIAEAEQNFLTPKREQALIWADLVPQMIANVTLTRWRDIKPEQLRWVALHIQRGRNLLAASALSPSVEGPVFEAYRRYLTPEKVEWLRDHLRSASFANTIAEIPTSILYALAEDPTLKDLSPDAASRQMDAMRAENLPDLQPQVIGRLFGTPKPTLTHSYRPGILNLRLFPALMGYSSRILAESWESNNLYYAALADEMAVPVNQLDSYIPEWNRSAIENIFATHLEDWPALMHSLQTTANNIRQQGEHAYVASTGNQE